MKKTLLLALAFLTLPILAFAAEELQFQPLTSIPAFEQFQASNNLSTFFDSLYKLCIGAAAVLAVFQIVKSGIIYSLGDTGFFEKREAKSTIMRAILGLLLVLSPAIVFSAIDERILNLDIGVGNLRQSETGQKSGDIKEFSDDDIEGESEEEENGDTAVTYQFSQNQKYYIVGAEVKLSPDGEACYLFRAGYSAFVDQCYTLRDTARAYLNSRPITTGQAVDIDTFADCFSSNGSEVTVRPDTELALCES